MRYLHSLNFKMYDHVLHSVVDCRFLDFEVRLEAAQRETEAIN